MKLKLLLPAVAALLSACGQESDTRTAAAGDEGAPRPSGAARDQIWAVGSSTVFPFTTRVAENFGRKSGGKAPRVESLGTGGGIKLFCSGVGPNTPDIANASRPMKPSEFQQCAKNGVNDIVEIKIGFDGLVIANARAGPAYDFRPQDIYMALAAEVPSGSGFARNPATTWKQVNPALPAERIQVYGPPPTSGTRDSFVELGMHAGAKKVPAMAALAKSDEDAFKERAGRLREDGGWIDSGENDNAIVQTLTRTPGALGAFGYSFLDQNRSTVKPARINGVEPTPATIADGSYPLSRSMFIYVKKAHLASTPKLREFVAEYVSDASAGRGGYLQNRGLIPLPADQLAAVRKTAADMTSMSKPAS
jgi:phosphate transport system substrate-binding protein